MQTNDVVDAIAIKLNQSFGDSFTIYTESIEQGFEEPCFFIALLEPDQTQVVGNRYHKTNPFDIHYFGSGNADAYATADKLMNEMEYIECINGDWLHGTKMRSRVEDGVLHFFVSYNFHIYKVKDPLDSMGGISVNGTIK